MKTLKLTFLFCFLIFNIKAQDTFAKLDNAKKGMYTVIVNEQFIANIDYLDSYRFYIQDYKIIETDDEAYNDKIPSNFREQKTIWVTMKWDFESLYKMDVLDFFQLNNNTKVYVDGYLWEDTTFRLIKKAIVSIEVTELNARQIISIWTINEKDRKSFYPKIPKHIDKAIATEKVEKVYDSKRNYNNNIAAAEKDGKWGYINTEGQWVIPNVYDFVGDFKYEVSEVKKGDHFFLINMFGEAISEKYDSILSSGPYFFYQKENLFGISDSIGNVLEPNRFQSIGGYYKNIVTLKYQGKWAAWNKGQVNYDEELYFTYFDSAPLYSNECNGIIDKDKLRQCNGTSIIKVISEHVKYPAIARENGIEGTVFARFIILKDGTIDELEIIKDIGAGCGKEVKRVIDNHLNQWAKAGEVDGMKVNAVQILPVRFRLQ